MTVNELKKIILTKLAARFPEPTELIDIARTLDEPDVCKVGYLLGLMGADELITHEGTAYSIAQGGQAVLYAAKFQS